MSTNTPARPAELRRRSPWDLTPWADLGPWASRLEDLTQQAWPAMLAVSEFNPGVDLHETDDGFELEVELPGVDRKDISIDVSGRRIRVHGTKTGRDREGVLRHSTRGSGAFTYESVLPSDIDESTVRASLRDGVLTVTLPKAVETKTTHIEIS